MVDGEAIFFDIERPPPDCPAAHRASVDPLLADFGRVGSWTVENADLIALRPDDTTAPPILLLARLRTRP